MKVTIDGLRAAMKNQLNVMKRPQIKRDPVNGMEAEARCPPLYALRYCIVSVEDSQPKALYNGLQWVIQRLKERINHRVSV